ncbi:MAG: thioredoxin domain-containing protein [Sandaracinaceae bacterium]
MKLQPGDVFAGKYRIERPLGEGGMGAVYVAINERLQKRVALKVISERVRTDPGMLARFTQEAVAASRVAHAGLVEIYDADQHMGTPWIAMELLDGESLAARIGRGPIPIHEAFGIAQQILDALAAVHAAGIIHRDLKPDNVFCCRDGRVKILDFGIAKLAVGEITGQTETGLALGTPFYLAPEQASSAKDVGPQADIYSLGVVLYQMISGHLPYDATSLGDLVRQMYTTGPVRLSTRSPHAPERLSSLIDRCLSVDPMQRPGSAREVASAIEAIANAPGPALTAPMPAASETPKTMALDSGALQAAISSPGAPFGGAAPPGFGAAPAAPGGYGGGGAFGAPAAGGFGPPTAPPTMAQTAAPVPPSGGPKGGGLGIGMLVAGCAVVIGLPLFFGALAAGYYFMAAEDPGRDPEPIVEAPYDPSVTVASLAPMAGADAERVRLDAAGPARGGAHPLVTIVTFSEFQCPYCGRVAPTMERISATYGDRVRYVYRHNPLAFHTNAMPAAQAAQEAYEQGGDARFWAMHDVLFENQQALERADLERYGAQAGLDAFRLRAALDDGRHQPRIQRDMDAAAAVGARGTPTFFINGRLVTGAQPYERFSEVVDEEIALAEALIARGVPRSRLYETFQRNAVERSTPTEPTRPTTPPADDRAIHRVPLEDTPTRGPDDALVTVVMFGDFQCPFCARVQPTLRQIEERYGSDVRFAFKHNPLAFHQNAMPAAQLAVEAQREGRFWPVHDALYENASNLSRETLERIARDHGMGPSGVRDALDRGVHASTIARDQELARTLGATGTPSFFINGRNLRGAQPFEAFQRVIDEELTRARGLVAAGTPRSAIYEAATRPTAAPAPAPSGDADRFTVPIPPRVPTRGNRDAALTLQIISDFQCPFCSRAVPTIDQVEERYGDRIRIVFRHYPLPFHQNAMGAAEASVEVYEQAGDAAFWAYHDLLFENQRSLEEENLVSLARRVRGVNAEGVRAALRDHRHRARVQSDMDAMTAAGMRVGTPTFLVGTRQVRGAQPFSAFQAAIDAELAAR